MQPARPAGALFGNRLARRLFGLFVAAALLPLALSDWLSSVAVAHIAESLDLHNRAQTTRQTSRQVLDRLLAAKALLVALPVAIPATDAELLPTPLPGLGRVFRSLTLLRHDGLAVWSSDASKDIARAWLHADTGLPAARPLPVTSKGDFLEAQLRIAGSAGEPARQLLGVRHHGVVRWIAELNPEYLWSPVTEASNDSAWFVLDAHGHTLTRFQGADFPGATANAAVLVESRSALFLGGEFGAGDWVFVQRGPPPEVRWHGQKLGVWLAWVALATLLAIALLSRWQIRRTLVPLEQLTEGARQLAAGAGGTRVAIRRDDEIGALAGAFNHMAEHIEAQFDALQGLSAIDRAILAGAPIERLAELVLRQLAAIYPGSRAALSWSDGRANLRHASLQCEAGRVPTLRVRDIALSPEQADGYAALQRDELGAMEGLPGAGELLKRPWLNAACPAGTLAMVLLPLWQQGSGQALIALGLPTPLAPENLQPARELRDRLAVARATRAREQELIYRAVHDSLTGLCNRYGLDCQLDALLGAGDDVAPAAVLLLDLDHFKDVNDSRGHDAGDELLCLASTRLLSCAPAGAIVARQGGDEFAIVLPGADAATASAVARQVIDRLGQPFALRGGEHVLGASVGIALSPGHARTRAELLRCGDIALYAAKAAGRGQSVLFTPALDAASRERVVVQAELRGALERREFVLHYQPRIRPRDGRVTSAEALIRWQHPERGLLLPHAFISSAESSGLIDAIGLWVLDAACAQMAAWRRQRVPVERISVNVSPQQLASGHLPGQVRATLERHALAATALELEVTESLLMGDAAHACAQLAELRASGVTIALDDFGTGYSSMATLRQLPIDVMKIDRSFVVDLGHDEGADAVIRAIVALARAMHLQLVAEGIETEAQSIVLRSLGCDELQGYLYSRPLAPDQFLRLPGLGGPALPVSVMLEA